jgi:hypothetical protein
MGQAKRLGRNWAGIGRELGRDWLEIGDHLAGEARWMPNVAINAESTMEKASGINVAAIALPP